MSGVELERKRCSEQEMVRKMIEIYCRGRHKSRKGCLCPECEALAAYAHARTEHCPRMAEKTFCSACPRPCYKPQLREQMKQVMRYAGPRMLLYDPVALKPDSRNPRSAWIGGFF